MAPRATRSQASGPSSTPGSVKTERKVKQEKQPNDKGKGKQRAQADSDEEEANLYNPSQEEEEGPRTSPGDEDAEGEVDEEAAAAGSPHGRKRARVDTDGNSRAVDIPPSKPRAATLPRDSDGFIPGSIVRIQLQNFVTYDYVQFRTGPYLNMILGPNGTGKSTIACAIAIGLNWPPSILGRASDLRSFVKQDKTAGYVEIELKGQRGKPNLVIRRKLTAASNSSSFTLNGQPATGKEIAANMGELNVQVGNLCSFLPQDRVSEFAAMSPQQLLRETQRAAGDERLTQWHDTLVASGKEMKQMEELIKNEVDQLKQMQLRNESIERDVQRYRERQQIEHNIALLKLLIPVEHYRRLRIRYTELKAEQRLLHTKVTQLKNKNKPAHDLLEKLSRLLKDYDKNRENAKSSTQAKFKKMSEKWSRSEDLEKDAEHIQDQLEGLKKGEKDRVKKIKSLEDDVAKLERDLAKPWKTEKEEDLIQEVRKINTERADVASRKEVLEDSVRENIQERAKHSQRLNSAEDELRKLDSEDARKLKNMFQWDKDTHDAIIWLRENKDKFKMQVFEPPYMCLTVPDGRFVNAVEACFGANQLKTFVAQCQEDLDTFNHYINDNPGLGRRVRIASWFRQVVDNLAPPPLSIEEIKSLGFEGYALEYVDCPPGMHWFLKREINLHRTPINLNGRLDTNLVMQRIIPSNMGGASVNFINGAILNMVQRSRYGKHALGNMTRDIRPARNLVSSALDPEVKRKLDNAILESRRAVAVIDGQRAEIDTQLKAINAEDAEIVARINAVKARRDAVRDAVNKRHQQESKLKQWKRQHQELLDAPPVDQERARLKKKLLSVSKSRVQMVKEYMAIARSVVEEQTASTRTGLEFLQASANRAALEALCKRKDAKFEAALAEWNKVDEAFRRVKIESLKALEETRAIVAETDDELRKEYDDIEAIRTAYDKQLVEAEANGTTPPSAEGVELRTMDELEAELQMQQTNLDLNLQTNPGIVEQYEKRQRDIAALEKAIDERKKKAEKVERNIKNARDNWKPALEKLVASIGSKFSAAFDRIGCAGEIRISEHEDYDKWAIDILVKFRDSEKLQLLTGQRQSGGERSLTTILYLMSLTEEARAPFSLVDEINQGMDQRAERMVHDSMVEVTCKPDSAQYFLITPKLLPNLKYHQRMKILCVNNGEWLPEEKNLGNMMEMIEGWVQRNQGAPSSAI